MMATEKRTGAEALVREGAEAFADMREVIERGGPLPCVVGLHGSLEECGRDAVMEIGRLLNPHVSRLNPEAERVLRAAVSELTALVGDCEQDEEPLVRAFPFIRERVCIEILRYPEDPESRGDFSSAPYDTFRHSRHLIHKLMRLAYEDGQDWLVETLEPKREETAAQAAYALALEGRPASDRS